MNIIEVHNISKSYEEKTIFQNLSFDIKEGDFVAIIGESGKGKSTLLNILGLLEEADSGDLLFEGEEYPVINSLKANKMLREKIGYLFQNFALIDDQTVNHNLQIALKYCRLTKKEKTEKVEEALEQVGLQDMLNTKIYKLSGGEQQRVALARIILKPSKLILADEPTGSLDQKNSNIIMDILKKLNEQGKTIVIVTHDLYIADRCKTVISLDK